MKWKSCEVAHVPERQLPANVSQKTEGKKDFGSSTYRWEVRKRDKVYTIKAYGGVDYRSM
jgi:hypothetical protein